MTTHQFGYRALALDHRVAIVTGAGSGIGRETALLMAARGARVAVADRNLTAAAETVALGQPLDGALHPFACDIGQPEDVTRLVEEVVGLLGRVDILHNNAAFMAAADRDAADLSIRVWDQTMGINARGTMLLCSRTIPHMVRAGGGAIVNTSTVGALSAEAGRPAYAASKAAIGALTRSIATQYGRNGIRCNQVLPGLTLTPAVRTTHSDKDLAILGRHNLVPLAEPHQIAEVVCFLASDAASYVTGATIVADGGASAHLPTVADLLGW